MFGSVGMGKNRVIVGIPIGSMYGIYIYIIYIYISTFG